MMPELGRRGPRSSSPPNFRYEKG